jgi:hypothetical protein
MLSAAGNDKAKTKNVWPDSGMALSRLNRRAT